MGQAKTPLQVLESDGQVLRARLWGRLDERMDFGALLEGTARNLILDLGDVQDINSSGVRLWMHFVGILTSGGRRLTLERCSTAIVKQLNMIYKFVGDGGRIVSVMAPYYCEQCDEEHDILVVLDEEEVDTDATKACPKCQSEDMEFDDDPEFFFAFRKFDYLD